MENHGIFERYHDGNMTISEKEIFLRKLNEDLEFKKEFELYNEITQCILNTKKDDAFIAAVKDAEKRYFNSIDDIKSKHNKNYNFLFKAAATVAIIAISSFLLYFIFDSKPTNKELFAQYYTPIRVDEITRSTEDSTSSIKEGFIAYQTGNYQNCLLILSSENETNELSTQVKLIKALSYLELGNYNNAENLLKQASEDYNNAFYDDCLWYLSLIYIKTDRSNLAIPILNKLVESKSVYNNKAEKILESIK